MQILLLNFERGWRGGERQTLICLEQFRDAGHTVALLARQGSELANAANKKGLTVYEERNVVGICKRLISLRKSFQVFHAQTANTLTWLVLLKPMLRGKIAFTRRTAFAVTKKASVTAWKWRQADLFVAISQAAAYEPSRLGVNVDYVISSTVEYVPENQSSISKLRGTYIKSNQKVVATAAALTPEKDPFTLINAINHLRELRDDFVFLHFGSGGSCEHDARQLVIDLGLEEHYKFAGFHANITDCYRLMDVFVISSKQEALGSSVLDAFLYKVPVVSTSAGGLSELLANGQRGLECKVGDSKCLANSINKLLNNQSLRLSLTSAAAEFVSQEHSVQKMAQRYLMAYKKLLY